MKVAKEDIMGLLASVEMWVERDHEAERRMWAGWVDEIAVSVGRVPGVETHIERFEGIMQREPLIGIKWDSKPRLEISWDSAKLGITGDEVYKRLYSEEPRVVLRSASGDGRSSNESKIAVVPMYMLRGTRTSLRSDSIHCCRTRRSRIANRPGRPTMSPDAGTCGSISPTAMPITSCSSSKRARISQESTSEIGRRVSFPAGWMGIGWSSAIRSSTKAETFNTASKELLREIRCRAR